MSDFIIEDDSSNDNEESQPYRPRRISVDIDYYDTNLKARVFKHDQHMSVDVLISALAGTICNTVNAIPYVPLDFQSKPIRQVDAYADAIIKLTEEEIQPFEIAFHYKDGFEKNYRILYEVK